MNRMLSSKWILAAFMAVLFTLSSCGTANISTSKGARQRDKAQHLRGGCCFTAETMIRMADGTERPISDLKIGDEILSFNFFTGRTESSLVMGMVEVDHNNLMEYTFDNYSIKATMDHPFFLKEKGWASSDPVSTIQYFNFRQRGVSCIQKGDVFYHISPDGNITESTLNSIFPIVSCQKTYSIVKLSRNEGYFANNTLTAVEKVAAEVLVVP